MVVVNKFDKKTSQTSYEFYFGPIPARRVAVLHLRWRKRNLFLTITDIQGSVIKSISAKAFALNRKKRKAPHITELMARKLTFVLKAYRIFSVRFLFNIAHRPMCLAAHRVLRANGIQVSLVMGVVRVAHNGCRLKKSRRL